MRVDGKEVREWIEVGKRGGGRKREKEKEREEGGFPKHEDERKCRRKK